ncbi:hypothetical protein LAZ67_X002484 [Cordylochernes scorpioides]|uniref:Integrase catalytic domain-containing protein n=1 Tax=Cordylochernes scorpioides TaxID=51811 RepID=A0ABY6LVX3_9ARAC|nr:hypothetical protein LAZ67_X002484 [Cordylochernes scorpioides]
MEHQETTNEPAPFTKVERKRRKTSASQCAPTAQSASPPPTAAKFVEKSSTDQSQDPLQDQRDSFNLTTSGESTRTRGNEQRVQDLHLGYSAIVDPPTTSRGSRLACLFVPGVVLLRHRVLWPGCIDVVNLDVHGQKMAVINCHLSQTPHERLEQLGIIAETAFRENPWVNTGSSLPFFHCVSGPTSLRWRLTARPTQPGEVSSLEHRLGHGRDRDSNCGGFLLSILVSLGLPPAFISWIQILYSGVNAAVCIGEHHTAAFPLLNGVRQGCVVSAAFFSLSTTPLLRRLQSALGKGNVIAYADDIVLMVRRQKHFGEEASIFQGFQRASGIRVNFSKSVASSAAPGVPHDISWTNTCLRMLGCDIRSPCRKDISWTRPSEDGFPSPAGSSSSVRPRAANCLLQARLVRFVWGPDSTAWLPASVISRPVSLPGFGLFDLGTQMQPWGAAGKPASRPHHHWRMQVFPSPRSPRNVLLPTLRVTLKGNRSEKTARAIIDTGSQRSYILHSTAMEMEYEQSRREFFRHSLFGGSSNDVVEHEVYTIHLSDINNSYRCEFEALGQPLICGSIPPVCPRSFLEGSEELDASDLMRDRIEVLIGADIAGRLLTDDQRRISSGLVAIRTKLGWTVMGKIPPTEVRDDTSSLCVTTLLSLDLENLCKLDAIGISDEEVEKTQSLQAEMEEHFAHTTTRDIEERYEVALPWVQDKEMIPTNRDLAENQLSSVRRKLEEVGDMKEYGQIFEECINQGIIEYSREDKLDGVHNLPHRPVYKRNSQTSKIRPVFNASAHKAPEHLKTTAEQLKSSFYDDNCLSSFQNVEETEKFGKQSTELLSTACFNLRDWDSYVEKTTLHIFCDASQFAYATCIFLRIEKEDRVDIQLIQARTRVAPLKKLTIPRLELLACLIGARLAANVIQDLEFEEIPRFYWTDSTNALCWIQREDNWAAFVMNRVKEIHNLSSPESWRHIPGRLNPANLPSRGCSAESLKETRWWEGPAWLKVSQEEWPKSTIIPDLEIVYSERRKTILNTLCTTRENENLFGRYSHFLRIVRITAWIYRFFNNAKIDRRKIISEDLSTEEITKSEIILIRLIQRESFSGHEDKKLQGFKLLVDSSGILRIKTKICKREDFANFRMPILLPSDHFLVSLLIRWNHETHGHAGLQTLLGILRENYWILRSRKTVKKIINQCIRCKRFTVTPATVESTSLPEDRVRDAAVFEIVGVDLTGHLILKNKKKAWIVIFTCAVYRGVHLELVTSLSMEAFLQALRRFIARRGRPLIVYSDNGTNFKGMANALKKIDFSRLKCDPTLKNITWKFIPPGAPWWGGWWERLIGMMKQLLFRILGQTSLGYEELSTVMCDVESLMNTRPLTYLTEESEDLAPLTPSLFLHEVREVGVPDLDLIDNQTLSRKYQYIKRVREDLRERFRIEYFGFLRQETRRLKTTIPFKVVDMVLIGQESLKRLHWPLARIIQLYPGKDGLVRVAKVKTSSGDKIRPIQKLYNLEITPEIRCRDPLTQQSPTPEVRLTTEEDPLTSQQEQHHIETPNVVSSYGRPIKRPNRLDLLNFSFPCLSRRGANSKIMAILGNIGAVKEPGCFCGGEIQDARHLLL